MLDILYSNIRPVQVQRAQPSFQTVFQDLASQSDRIEIAVGYVSHASLEELRRIVSDLTKIQICLNLGMYVIEGMPCRLLQLARTIHHEWQESGKGEIRAVKSFKYHGKIYAFYKLGTVHHAIVGSANLSALCPDAQTRRQYEVSTITNDPEACKNIALFIEELKTSKISDRIDNCNIRTYLDRNLELEGDNNALKMPSEDFHLCKRYASGTEFILPLKVPHESEKLDEKKGHFTKSNVNVCYSAPRSKGKSRDWYEIQFTVDKEIRDQPGYPEHKKPFFVLTDDGYLFKVHTTSDNNKQFSAVGDELTLGRWLKGRFVATGLVAPVTNTQSDTDRSGMITMEMLDMYGCHALALQKTSRTYPDESGKELELWLLSFKMEEGHENGLA